MLCKVRDSRGDPRGEVKSFSKLFVLEFDSTRKRMSVVARYPCGRVFLVTKVGEPQGAQEPLQGAETSVLPLCIQGEVAATNRDIDSYALVGLRTLAVARRWVEVGRPVPRELAEVEVEEFRRSLALAQQSLEGREAAIQ